MNTHYRLSRKYRGVPILGDSQTR
ncbi:hypothetical protein H6G20_06860 [Desertifilum sp. FACHB-1129]|nr:hypothetical protein [Desertifilum sp. FACHB-1129]MBD2321622.1 hypothetical protein [Desertifilum sp. FACHB-866]MBD2331749.1 hypothetical protein [Desertifilum sp. FACHB-868]